MKKNISIAVVILLFYLHLSAAITGNQVGKVKQKNAAQKEVVISIPRAAEKFQMGDRLAIVTGEGEIVLTVTFPMMTVAKARVLPKYHSMFDRIRDGMPVYRDGGDERISVRYYRNYDSEYLNKYRKVKFIDEVKQDELASTPYYFLVEYNSRGMIVKTAEFREQRKTVVDYYRDDAIIKKEWYGAGGENLEKLNVYDYYDNLMYRETGEFDYINKTRKIVRYDENGGILSEERGRLDEVSSDPVTRPRFRGGN